MERRLRIFLVVLGIFLVVTAPVAAEAFLSTFYQSSGTIHYETDSGLEVVTTKNYELRSGNPFTSKSYNLSTKSNGYVNLSAAGTASVQVEQIQGTWTNVSHADASANITIAPGDKNRTIIGAGTTKLAFRDMGAAPSQTGVNDDETDLIYSASSNGIISIQTNATQGTAYGMVDPQTREGLDVAVADANGVVTFDEVPAKTDQAVRIEELGTITIREETPPHSKITGATARVKFFEDNQDEPTIVERETTNGEIDLTGLPITRQFVVQVRAPGYHNRTVVLDDLSQQETVFLANRSLTTVENQFVVSDRTGNFPPESTEIIIQRTVNRSEYGGSPSGFSWTTIAGDDLGADEGYIVNLIDEDRYRILVRNEDGDTRVLGAYTAESAGTITLNIGSVVVDPEAPDTIGVNATRTNATGDPVRVHFEFNDSSQNTTTIYLRIHEFKNESNELLSNTTFTGTYGVFKQVTNVPASENNTDWIVEYVAKRDSGQTVTGELVVGARQTTPLSEMPDWVIAFFFTGIILTTGGLMSQRNGPIGAIVMSGMAGMCWFIGVVPEVLGIGVVVLSMIAGGIFVVRDRRAGGL